MSDAPSIFVGMGDSPRELLLSRANRHGLIAGATGTGKTVSLQILAEGFSNAGVPVFMADVKGDLSGMGAAGKTHPKLEERADTIGLETYDYQAYPVEFWDLYAKKGHPIRTTISEMGPLLLSRLLELNDVQSGVIDIAFAVADDNGMLLLDLKDLRAILVYLVENRADIAMQYGNVSSQSVGAIQRRLLGLERSGGKRFFGEPALELSDLLRCDEDGRGIVNILAADELMRSPRLYSTFLLWLLSELFEELPEVGDPDKPVLVFFFDEAHLLFDDAPRALLETVEQVVRLIRSKGVGVFFVTQNPDDVPGDVLGQLGNRIQHALRAFTPRERKAVKTAAETFRTNPKFDAAEAITELGVGEALVSTLGPKGRPTVVERTLIRPPESRLGPLKRAERRAIIAGSDMGDRYADAIDRESAFEILSAKAEAAQAEAEEKKQRSSRKYKEVREAEPEEDVEARPRSRRRKKKRSSTGRRQGYVEAVAKSVLRSVGSQVGRSIGKSIIRGLLGSMFKGR